MANLLDRASVVLTPTAYDDGKVLCVKPSEPPYGDFDFSRNSSATRVNAQGLVEDVQILSGDLVQNGDFSQIGAEEVSNGSFSQEGSELITNGSFDTDTTWAKETGWGISGGTANCDGTQTSNSDLKQALLTSLGKSYKITYTISDYTSGSIFVRLNSGNITTSQSSVGTFTEYLSGGNGTQISLRADADFVGSIDNVSVREVGQDWSLGSGWSIAEDKAISDGTINQGILQENIFTIGKIYKITFDVDVTSGTLSSRIRFNGSGTTTISNISASGSYTFYQEADRTGLQYIMLSDNTATSSITNISVKEVGQNWSFGDGFTPDQVNSKATCDGTQTAATNLQQTITTNIQNQLVRVSFTLDYTAGLLLGSLSGTGGIDFNNITSSGTYTADMTSNEVSPILTLQGDASFIGSITNVIIKSVTNDTNLPRINYEGFSYQDALGSELITNGDFSNGFTNWTTYGNTSVSNGVATIGASANSGIYQGILSQSKSYKVTINVTAYNGVGQAQVANNTGFVLYTINAVGEHTFTFEHIISQTNLIIRGLSNALFSIDNVSVKEYLGQEVVPNSGCGSWLWEPQSTNLIPYSEDLSDTSWSKINSGTASAPSVTANYGISPDGTQNASRVIFDLNGGTTSSDYSQTQSFATSTVGNDYTTSVYMKSNNSNSYNVTFTNVNGSTNVVSVTPQWQRFDSLATATTTSVSVRIRTRGSEGSSDVTDVLIWGAMLEEQSYATSYIPTEGTTKTRNQDLCNNGGSVSTISSTEGVLYAEISALADDLTNRYITISNGGNSYIRLTYTTTSNQLGARYYINGTFQTALSHILSDETEFIKVSFKWKENDFALWVNGTEVATDTSGLVNAPNTFNRLEFQRYDGVFHFFGKTKCVAVWKEALSDTELTELTTI